MENIVLYCKSFRGDAHRVKILLDSIYKYNNDNLPFYISVPKSDIEIFKQTLGTTGYILLEDESIYNHNTTNWKSQQIVKASFWKTNVCKNYVMIDSDSYFIRPFTTKDFIVEGTEDTPYTVMHEQKELFDWTCNKSSILGFNPQDGFAECRKSIMDIFGRTGRYYDFGPSPVIWSSKVWESLENNYITPNNLTFENLIHTVASEFSWYGEWILANKDIPIWPIEPMFKVMHYKQQYEEYKKKGYLEEDFSKVYMGIVMQSNYGAPLKY